MRTTWHIPLAAFLVLVTAASLVAPTAARAAEATAGITLYVDGRRVETDVAPVLRDGRVFVPLRAAATALGAQVGWNSDRQEATVTHSGTVLQLKVGQREAVLNSKPYTADAAPFIAEGRTLVPLRVVAEALGAGVAWEAASRSVRITLPGQSAAPAETGSAATAPAKPGSAVAADRPTDSRKPAEPSWASEVPGPSPSPTSPSSLLPPPPAPPGPPAPPAALTSLEKARQNFEAMYPGMHVAPLVSKFPSEVNRVSTPEGGTQPVYAPMICYSGPKPQSVAILLSSRFGYIPNTADSSGRPIYGEFPPRSMTLAFSNQPGYLPVPDYLKESWNLTPEEFKAGVNPRTHPSYRPGLPLDAKGDPLPVGCALMRNDLDVADRSIVDAVIQDVPYDIDASIQADTAAWEAGKPARIYLRVDAKPKAMVCTVPIRVSVPDWFKVVEAQGADIRRETWSTTVGADDATLGARATTLSASPHQLSMGVHTLTWTTRLETGHPFERWIDVVPGTPPPDINIESVGVIFWGIAFQDPKGPITAWSLSRGVWNKQVHLPLAARFAPGKARLAANMSRLTQGIYDIDFTMDPGTLEFWDQKLAVWAADDSGNLTPITVGTENGKPVNTLWPNPPVSKKFRISVRTPTAWGTAGFLLPAGTTKLVAEIRGSSSTGTYQSEERLEIPLTGVKAAVEAELTLRADKAPEATPLPPARQPTDNVQPGGCLSGGGSQPDQAFIALSVKPPFLSEKRQNQAHVEAVFVGDSTGRLPLTLQVSAPGKLTDVQDSGRKVTATLSATGLKSGVLTLSATAADGTSAFASVPVGGDAVLEGQVDYRSGNLDDESPIQRAHLRVDAQWDKLTYVPEVYSGSRGDYSVAVEADKQMTVAVDAADYAPATFTMPPTAPDDQGVIHAPAPVYLVKRETLAATRRRLELVRRWHDDLRKGGALLTQAGMAGGGLTPSQVPDPTVADGLLAKYLERVEAGTKGEAYAEEALKRLDLALELTNYADPETRRFAEEFVGNLWDGGLGLLSKLWAQASQALQLLQGNAVNARVIDLLDAKELDDKFRKDLNWIESAMWSFLSSALIDQDAGQEAVTQQQEFAKNFFGWLKSKLRAELASRWDQAAPHIDQQLGGVGLEPGSAAETAIMNWIKSGPMEVVKGELQGLVAGYLAAGYLDMVNEELAQAILRAQSGQFAAGGIAVARDLVHRDIRDLQFLATINTETVITGEFRTFAEGAITDYEGWGKWALLGVTAGGAAPVLAGVDRVIPLVQGLIAGRKFMDAAKVYLSILYPDGDWWTAVKKGIRDAMDAKAVLIAPR